MKLIEEIIDILSEDKSNLTNALLKTKVLLYKLGNNELIEWVNNEINGYSENAEVPPYRTVNAQVLANFANMAYQYTAHPIPLMHLDDEYRESLERTKLRQSLSVLEELASKEGGSILSPIPLEANSLLRKGLAGGYHIQRAWCQISDTELTQSLIEVRSRLLDFILELSGKLGENLSDEEVKNFGKNIDTNSMFANAMFGDNTTILLGDHGQQKVTHQNVKNDFESLCELLRSQNVTEPDIQELKTALDTDKTSPDVAKRDFGPAVKGWLKKMLSKAVDAAWQIEISVASSFLTEALNKYYGW
jgi:AbiTii